MKRFFFFLFLFIVIRLDIEPILFSMAAAFVRIIEAIIGSECLK